MNLTPTFKRYLWLGALLLTAVFMLTAVAPTYAAAEETAPEALTETAVNLSGVYHTVRPGEYLGLIAQYYGVTVQAILQANPHIHNMNLIFSGTVLYIPTGYYSGPQYPGTIHYQCRYHHTVKYGENLIGIGRWYGVSPFAIAESNSIYNLNYIYAGQFLCIP